MLKFSLRAWGSGPQREDQDLSLAWLLCCCCVIMFLLGESSRSELTFLVVVVPRGPGNQDPRERIRTSLQPGDLVDSWKGGKGLPPLGAWGSGPHREDQDLSSAWLLCCCCVIMFLLGESSRSELTFLVVDVPRGPGNQDPRVRIRTSLQPGDLMACCGCHQGAWELGSQREDQDLFVAWGLDGLMERREWITTSLGLGIRTPERGLGPLFSLVVVLLLRDNFLIG